MTEDDCVAVTVERLRAKADELKERAQQFDKQIAERMRWIESCLRDEADLRTAIAALERPSTHPAIGEPQ